MNLTYVIAFCASFVFIGLRSFQQLNTVYRRYGIILPTSMCMALCEYFLFRGIVTSDWTIAIAMGLGGGIGSTLATWFSYRYFHKE